MSEYPLIIEKGSNYAFVINESKNIDFDKIRDYSTEFYKMLPSKMQERLYDEIMHGACELDSEPKLNAYMFALGKMHNAKLQYAYDHLSDEFLNEKQIDIIDYACGQGVGTICYADFLKRKHLNQNVRRIILIEPSEKALARAALNISAIFPDAELVTINKGFDDLTNDDLFPDKDTPTLHVISNVLDMATTYNSDGFFDLEDFANLISRAIDGKNEFVCVEPLFGYAPKDEKVDAFIRAAGIEIYCSIAKGKREFVDNKDWTCVVRVGKVYKNVRSNANISNFYFDEILKKAEQGNASAQNNLGYCYKHGQGVAQDYEKAVEWYRKSAEQGEASAQNSLGYCYYNGQGVAQDYEKAVEWHRRSAEQGNASAQNNLGYCYYNGQGVAQDYEKAVEWYRRSAEQGNASAQNSLGYCYYNGQGVAQDYEKAVEWYRKSAEQGEASAQNNLGYCYEHGQGVAQDYEKAVEWYRKSAEQGNASAQNNLGYCYKHGQGVAQDYEKAVEWHRKSAEQGNASAQNSLGYCYYNGQGVAQDYEKAVEWHRKSAEQGNASAQNNLGYCYKHGQGVAQDYEKAVEWYRRSAEQGNASAQNNLGYCYEHGQGVEQDYEKAVEWYRKSAEQGDADAQNNLGYCYYNGQGVAQDYEKAVEWHRKSAKQGVAVAQNNLGYFYAQGQGVAQDYEKAVEWYRRSAEQGFARAQEHLSILEKKIKEIVQKINGHEYVDLGLPSGLKWATCNVGANSPEEYGDYYAWGETETKDEYTYENSSTCYKQMNDISGNPKYDVARKKWGGKWRMPTYDEMEELTTECVWTWKIQNGIKGCKVEGPNGNSIFLPVAGLYGAASLYDAGGFGCYWSSTPYCYNDFAYSLNFVYTSISNNNSYRILGMTIRPVTE